MTVRPERKIHPYTKRLRQRRKATRTSEILCVFLSVFAGHRQTDVCYDKDDSDKNETKIAFLLVLQKGKVGKAGKE